MLQSVFKFSRCDDVFLLLLLCVNGDTLKVLTNNGPVFLRVINVKVIVVVIVFTRSVSLLFDIDLTKKR